MTRRAGVLLVLGVVIATVGAGGGYASAAPSVTSQSLARRLDHAGLCVRVGPVRGLTKHQLGGIGVRGAWHCDAHAPTNGGRGGTEIVTWAAPTARHARRAVSLVNAGLRHACAEPGHGVNASSDDPGVTRPAEPRVSTQYVVGDGWVAFVQVNAPLRRVASTLHGRAVAKHCG